MRRLVEVHGDDLALPGRLLELRAGDTVRQHVRTVERVSAARRRRARRTSAAILPLTTVVSMKALNLGVAAAGARRVSHLDGLDVKEVSRGRARRRGRASERKRGRTGRGELVEDGEAADGALLELERALGLLLDGVVLEHDAERLFERRDRLVEACEHDQLSSAHDRRGRRTS